MHEPPAPAVPEEATRPRLARPLAVAILAAAVVAGHGGALDGDFVHDDRSEILQNRFVHDLGHVREILTTPSWGFKRQGGETPGERGYRGESNYYRPVQYLSYAVLYRAFGPSPRAFHASKLLLHFGSCLLLFLVVAHHREELALPCALLFAVHPALSEAVTWVSAVTDVACGFFFLMALLAYVRWRQRPRPLLLALLYGSFLAGMFSKETTIVFLPALVAYQRLVEGRWPRASDVRRVYAPLCLVAAGYLGLRLAALGAFLVPGRARFDTLAGAQRVLNQVVLLSEYILKFFRPEPLNAFHWFEPVLSLADRRVALALAVLGGGAALAVWLGRRLAPLERRLFLFGLVWTLLALAPPVALFQRIGLNVFAERYLYLPLLGLCLSAGAALSPLLRRHPVPTAAVLAALAALCVWRLRERDQAWRDSIAFYEDVTRQSPKADLWQSLGDAYADSGRYDEALAAYRTMLSLYPDRYQTYSNLGIAYHHLGRLDDAVEAFRKSVAITPNEMALANLGIVYHELGRFDEALRAYDEALALRPTGRAYYNLGTTYYLGLHRLPEAIAAYEEALRLEPGKPEAVRALAVVREELQKQRPR